jgi:hypothetical protein
MKNLNVGAKKGAGFPKGPALTSPSSAFTRIIYYFSRKGFIYFYAMDVPEKLKNYR